MQKPKMMGLSEIDWKAVLKSVIFIMLCNAVAFCVIVFTSVILLSLTTNGFEQPFEITKSNVFVVRALADSVLFFGFWKSMSFIKHHKLQHMLIITLIICWSVILSFIFYETTTMETIKSFASFYSIMFLAYFIRKAVALWRGAL